MPLGVRAEGGLAVYAWARVRTKGTLVWTCSGGGWGGCAWESSGPTTRTGQALAGCNDAVGWRTFTVSETLPATGGSLALRGDTLAVAAYANDGTTLDVRVVRVDP